LKPSDELPISATLDTEMSSARMRVGRIGEVTGVGGCWRLEYLDCEHVQEFAREGLEDPERLMQCIERNFSECLTCRLERGGVGNDLPR
jgi:hypothetical protein